MIAEKASTTDADSDADLPRGLFRARVPFESAQRKIEGERTEGRLKSYSRRQSAGSAECLVSNASSPRYQRGSFIRLTPSTLARLAQIQS